MKILVVGLVWLLNWNDQGIFTVEDYERDSLITSVYEMHKDAYGVKGRHYNFDKMSNKELEEELEHLCKVAQAEREALKASAKQKLIAGEPLTEAEADTLVL